MIGQIGRFGVVGIVATLLHISAALISKEVFGLIAQTANLIGFGVAFLFSFAGHFRFTFAATGSIEAHFTRFACLSIVAFFLSSTIVYSTTSHLNWPFWASILVVGLTIPFVSFFISKYWAFEDAAHLEKSTISYQVVILLGVQLIAYYYWMSLGDVNHDTGWYLVATQKWLSGAQLYVDIVEVNPPWNFYLTVPVIWLSKLTGLTPSSSHFAFTGFLTLVSLTWVNKLLRRSGGMAKIPALITTQCALMAILITTINQPGQREHIFVLFILPLLFGVYCQVSGDLVSRKERIYLAIFAVLGICIKPHFTLVPLFIAISNSLIQKSFRPIFQIENWIMFAGCLFYLIFARLVHPEFFAELLPVTFAVYGEFGFGISRVISRIPIYIILLLFLCCISVARNGKISQGPLIFAAAVFSSYVIYWVQATGFNYQSYPFFIFSLIFCVVAVLNGASNAQKILFALAALVMAWSIPIKVRYSNGFKFEVRQHLTGIPQASSVLFLSTNVSAGFPIVMQENLNWASRFPAQWFLPGALSKLVGVDCTKETDHCAQMNAILDQNREANTNDLINSNAEIIIVDNRQRKSYIKGTNFDYIDFMSADKRFVKEFQNFELFLETKRLKSWRRKH
ncbi:hypothetical protein BFP76_00765 [Amylibacter kogurei]|uniref:GtrA/DPMS transmembrane domain-containing protein n=1 Tax=Paramylibacter kogurei TaxID=1889778 RepID=A0A2G5K841_9RHOB|nr:GtrA family protein [Amylibacter kogurei]PIB25696.1 hypothetical protein BFP76_00765 [Amylibacter kogurei]